jgi:TolB protein
MNGKRRICVLIISLLVGAFLAGGSASSLQAQSPGERLVFAAYRNGQWDLYSAAAAAGGDLRQITNDPYEDRDPAYSPDGSLLAYASRRERNWDVYLLDLRSGAETRLTTDLHYDGAPTWSPDGGRLAFESFRNGDLDVWVIALSSGELVNLTADSASGDFGPAWAPEGEKIAFASWREGSKDLFLVDAASGEVEQLTESPAAEELPAWSPDGERLAFVRNWLGAREVYVGGVFDLADARQVTWFGRDDAPVWAPDGERLAFVTQRYDGEQVGWLADGGGDGLPTYATEVAWIDGEIDWHADPVTAGAAVETLASEGPSPLYVEEVTPSQSSDGEPWDLLQLADVDLPTPDMTPYLSDRVDDSYYAVRKRIADETGYDYLGELSEAYRPVQFYSDVSEYASWHKSGRALDTLFDFHNGEGQVMELVRDDRGGETYWRVMLRCLAQDGSCGCPLTDAAWNYSRTARTELAPDEGGVEKGEIAAYYVDLTALMREYGWTRISSWDSEEFSWTWHFKGFEYWHYQKTDGLPWYQAMLEVHPPDKVNQLFTYEDMREKGDPPVLIALKGVPLPAEARLWWRMLQP